jgi:hypothetical protein
METETYACRHHEGLHGAEHFYWHKGGRGNCIEWQRSYERARKPDRRPDKLRRDYNMTVEQYDAMLAAQGGLCAICGTAGDGRNLAIDHDHSCCPEPARSCGKCVRGLLCARCNRSLGGLGDTVEAVMRAVDYLRKWDRSGVSV